MINLKKLVTAGMVATAITLSGVMLYEELVTQRKNTAKQTASFPDGKLTTRHLETAQQNPALRQRFLTRLFEENPLDECEGLFYDPEFKESEAYKRQLVEKYGIDPNLRKSPKNANVAANTPVNWITFGRKTKIPIFVLNYFFDGKIGSEPAIATLDEAVNTIFDHEGWHARDWFHGIQAGEYGLDHDFPEEKVKKFMFPLTESRAYYNQLAKIQSKNVRAIYQSAIMQSAGTHGFSQLHELLNDSDSLTRDIVKAQLMQMPGIDISALGGNQYNIRYDWKLIK